MKLLIDIPEEVYKTGTLGLYFDCYSMKLHDTILSGTPIPDNATNGDVIKAMFPDVFDVDIEIHNITVYVIFDRNVISFDLEWWNAPYQKGGK